MERLADKLKKCIYLWGKFKTANVNRGITEVMV